MSRDSQTERRFGKFTKYRTLTDFHLLSQNQFSLLSLYFTGSATYSKLPYQPICSDISDDEEGDKREKKRQYRNGRTS